jgi:hypothetical protein
MTSYNLLICRFYNSVRALVSDPYYGAPLLPTERTLHMTSYNLLMCRFYDSRRVLVSDPDYGPLLSSLLVGPCT